MRNHYPFLEPSDDIDRIIADAYLAYEDRDCVFQRPFRIAWLYGFGVIPVAPIPGFPTPGERPEAVIYDANDAVVFDSTVASFMALQPWNDSLQILEWRTTTAILRLVQFTAFDEDETPIDFPLHLAPSLAVLHERTLERVAPRLTKIRVGMVVFDMTDVNFKDLDFIAGHNVELTPGFEAVTDGTRRNTSILMTAAPAGGPFGRFPGCDETQNFLVRKISSNPPTDGGHFAWDGDGCYRIQRPATLISEPPASFTREFLVQDHAIQPFQDCGPCCSCDDFEAVYRAIINVNDAIDSLRERAEDTRDLHQANIDRWNASKLCRESNSLNISLVATCSCFVSFGFQWCNLADVCAEGPVAVEFFISSNQSPDGVGYSIGSVLKQEFYEANMHNTTLFGTWPAFSMTFDSVDPGSRIRGRFDISLASCSPASSISVFVQVRRDSGTVILAQKNEFLSGLINAC